MREARRELQGIAFEEGNLQLALAEAEDHVSLLRLFHEQACERRLADNDVDGQLAVDAIGHAQHQAARAQQAGGFRDALADKVGHGDFAAVDGDAHRSNGAKERGGSENEDEKGHLAELFEALAEIQRGPWLRRVGGVGDVVGRVSH